MIRMSAGGRPTVGTWLRAVVVALVLLASCAQAMDRRPGPPLHRGRKLSELAPGTGVHVSGLGTSFAGIAGTGLGGSGPEDVKLPKLGGRASVVDRRQDGLPAVENRMRRAPLQSSAPAGRMHPPTINNLGVPDRFPRRQPVAPVPMPVAPPRRFGGAGAGLVRREVEPELTPRRNANLQGLRVEEDKLSSRVKDILAAGGAPWERKKPVPDVRRSSVDDDLLDNENIFSLTGVNIEDTDPLEAEEAEDTDADLDAAVVETGEDDAGEEVEEEEGPTGANPALCSPTMVAAALTAAKPVLKGSRNRALRTMESAADQMIVTNGEKIQFTLNGEVVPTASGMINLAAARKIFNTEGCPFEVRLLAPLEDVQVTKFYKEEVDGRVGITSSNIAKADSIGWTGSDVLKWREEFAYRMGAAFIRLQDNSQVQCRGEEPDKEENLPLRVSYPLVKNNRHLDSWYENFKYNVLTQENDNPTGYVWTGYDAETLASTGGAGRMMDLDTVKTTLGEASVRDFFRVMAAAARAAICRTFVEDTDSYTHRDIVKFFVMYYDLLPETAGEAGKVDPFGYALRHDVQLEASPAVRYLVAGISKPAPPAGGADPLLGRLSAEPGTLFEFLRSVFGAASKSPETCTVYARGLRNMFASNSAGILLSEIAGAVEAAGTLGADLRTVLPPNYINDYQSGNANDEEVVEDDSAEAQAAKEKKKKETRQAQVAFQKERRYPNGALRMGQALLALEQPKPDAAFFNFGRRATSLQNRNNGERNPAGSTGHVENECVVRLDPDWDQKTADLLVALKYYTLSYAELGWFSKALPEPVQAKAKTKTGGKATGRRKVPLPPKADRPFRE